MGSSQITTWKALLYGVFSHPSGNWRGLQGDTLRYTRVFAKSLGCSLVMCMPSLGCDAVLSGTGLVLFNIKALEDNTFSLERFKTSECSESALAALRRQIIRLAAMFDTFEAIDLLNSLLRLARSEGQLKDKEQAAAQDKIRARKDYLDAPDTAPFCRVVCTPRSPRRLPLF